MPRQREEFRWDGSPWIDEPAADGDLMLEGGINHWQNGGPAMESIAPVPPAIRMPPVREGGPTMEPLPPVDSPAMIGLGGGGGIGGVDPWKNGGPTQMPSPSLQGLATLGGSAGGGPSTQLMTPGGRSMPQQSRAMTTRASKRPGRAVY